VSVTNTTTAIELHAGERRTFVDSDAEHREHQAEGVALADCVRACVEVGQADHPDAADEQEERAGDHENQREDVEHVHRDSTGRCSSGLGTMKYLAIARFPMKLRIA
jgi:hypothetical protein